MEKMENKAITFRLYGGIAILLVLVALGMHFFG